MIRVFWGAGRRCKLALELYNRLGFSPDYIVDNCENKWGTYINEVEVISPSVLEKNANSVVVYITFEDDGNLREQLLNSGISETNIHNVDYGMLIKKFIESYNSRILCSDDEKSVWFDLQNGMVLGGIESFTYIKSKFYFDKKYRIRYIIPDTKSSEIRSFKEYKYDIESIMDYALGDITSLAKKIASNSNSICISNFLGQNYWAICLAKKINPRIKHFAIVHNDDEYLYQQIRNLYEYIDEIIVISNKMKMELITHHVPEEDIRTMRWKIPVDHTHRSYSTGVNEPIRIGYAGRITKNQKQLHQCVELMTHLRKERIEFVLEVAGDGDYLTELLNEVQVKGFDNCFAYHGRLNEEEIKSFWREQDVMISFSKHEGHSISQVEAMACGAVPVITNVSGAEDDISHGINGYIYEIDDLYGAVEYIRKLYNDRTLLMAMGNKAKDRVREIYEYEDNIIWG